MAKLELGWENSKAAVANVAISHILLFKFKLKKKKSSVILIAFQVFRILESDVRKMVELGVFTAVPFTETLI